MDVAKLKVARTYAGVVSRDTITAGLGGATISVEYAPGIWDGLTKTVVFIGSVSKDVITNDTTIKIPPEVLTEPNKRLRVGFCGVDHKNMLVIPTIWADLGLIQPGADPSGDTSTDPGLPVWAQIAGRVDELADEVEGLKQSGGVGPGTPGKPGADGEDGGYYTPSVSQPDPKSIQFSYTPSKTTMPAVEPETITLPVPESGGNVDDERIDAILDCFEFGTVPSKNLLNPATITHGVYVNWTNGNLANNANCLTSDYIAVTPGDVLVGSWVNADGQNLAMKIRYHCFYDADKKFTSGSGTTADTIVVPNGVEYVRVSIYASTYNTDNLQIEKSASGTFTPFEPYGEVEAGARLSEDVVVPEVEEARGNYDNLADRLDAMVTGSPTFVLNLPAKLYALVGEELNIYFDNLVDGHDTDYNFDVTCSVGMQMERCYRLTAETAGSYDISISATDRYGVTVEKSSTIIVSATSAGNGVTKSLIVLGDSTTNNGTAVSKMNENFSSDVMSVTTLGTRGASPNNHEGRSGWTFAKYFTDPGDESTANPFYNPNTKTFDPTYYFTNSGVDVPDWFFVNLGINDTFGLTTDDALSNTITALNGYCDNMIASLKAAAPNIKIGVCLTIPPNYSQDAFGKAYKCGQTRQRYKRNNVLWVQNQIERYDGREAENIYLVPIYTNLDTKYNMGMEQIQYNKRNTEKYASPIGNGGVHPVESGYWQIADIYWFFLKNQA